jgi:Tfp pilus assembly protein PilP
MRAAITLVLGILLMLVAPGAKAQAKPGVKSEKPAPRAAVRRGARQAPRRARSAAAPGARAQARPHAARPAQAAKQPKPAEAPKAEAASTAQPAPSEAKVARRDPFESLLNVQKGNRLNLPPGIAGLQVSTLQLNGIVKAPNGMIAVVTNPQSRTYFLREGDQLYDGRVDKIAMDSVTFHEEGKDAFGKPVEREVSKRLYSSAGEQQ